MAMYTISTKSEHALLVVRAADYNHAARIAARKLSRRRGVVSLRTTGDAGKSGWFAGYVNEGGGLNSTGLVFHVM